jgi:UDPglucose--hexose-1-phosphate uridylyltransferase
LQDYLQERAKERIVFENDHFVALVPFWAIWPYETMIISKRHLTKLDFKNDSCFCNYFKTINHKIRQSFETSFPYSSGIHQAPTDGEEHQNGSFTCILPPLLRSATVKKIHGGI